MTRKVVITGASRGLGMHLADMATTAGDDVQAAKRTPTKASDLPLDMDDPSSIAAFAARLEQRLDCVDILINNAGVDARSFGSADDARDPFDLDGEHLLSTMRTNVVGPMLLTRALLPLLRKSAKPTIVNISSQLASMEVGRTRGNDVGYSASKAALNSLTVRTAHLLADDGFVVVALQPGWLRTEMGGDEAPFEVTEGATAVWRTINGLRPEHNGQFLQSNGEPHPW